MKSAYVSTPESITDKATRSIKWLFMMEDMPRAISPVTFVILARLLNPEDYGLVAVAQITISFSQLFWDAGLEKALIQTNEPLEKAANCDGSWCLSHRHLHRYCSDISDVEPSLAGAISDFFTVTG